MSAISNLSEGNLLGVQEHLQKAKCDLEKRIKLIRFADKSPAGWAAVEEYESDELAEILKTRRNFERMSDVRLPRLSRSLPNLVFQSFQILLNPKNFKLHKCLDLLLLLRLFHFCSL